MYVCMYVRTGIDTSMRTNRTILLHRCPWEAEPHALWGVFPLKLKTDKIRLNDHLDTIHPQMQPKLKTENRDNHPDAAHTHHPAIHNVGSKKIRKKSDARYKHYCCGTYIALKCLPQCCTAERCEGFRRTTGIKQMKRVLRSTQRLL
ncbi:hypothetical protein VOLCADRAFT_102855 [Volvox carteri f. nagariensis]|uniref:Uncharacterized protein n=1 Tax=Volvox carteri f. nagariensis TaxID=3068 RepID=D8TII6_VOLCA|nr:uncharacterized protein VOLCADRAFT_102855 [Volvox carteri f. nagariensis]EFJ52898.1 hypothetical protein VOLCADRAFT_102855 [Volvox carteri f. nagariensis]|eukprot:XP_002945903.1 hypothetical protein VOLCADRAFT_102855 [Volvox carteri f. nagariensis]